MEPKSYTILHERVTRLEIKDKNQAEKITEIHKALVGNGQPGLLAEWNQWKGGVKLFGVIISVVLSIVTVFVGVLACI